MNHSAQDSISNPAQTLAEVAAAWHDRMVDKGASAETKESFSVWLDRAPEHKTAYEGATLAWAVAKANAHHPQILALRHETALRLTRKSYSPRARQQWAAAAALMAICGIVGFLSWPRVTKWLPTAAEQNRILTQTGERLTSRLPDGTQVTLNTQTELEMHFTAAERRVDLLRGQAFFEVFKDKNRPFVVYAQGRRFIAVGTSFDVRVDPERVQVTMVEGTVRVERLAPAPNVVIATITAGQQLTVEKEYQERVRSTDSSKVTSWRLGQVIFEDSKLSDAVAELNRYSETQIRLEDPRLAQLRVSGAFTTGDPKLFVEALTNYFPIEVKRSDSDGIVLGSRKQE